MTIYGENRVLLTYTFSRGGRAKGRPREGSESKPDLRHVCGETSLQQVPAFLRRCYPRGATATSEAVFPACFPLLPLSLSTLADVRRWEKHPEHDVARNIQPSDTHAHFRLTSDKAPKIHMFFANRTAAHSCPLHIASNRLGAIFLAKNLGFRAHLRVLLRARL